MIPDRAALVAEAILAPSVHNVQPARWRLVGDDQLLLLEDRRTQLPVGDPTGHDAAISLGAAAEGLRLAAARQGASLASSPDLPDAEGPLVPVASYRVVPGGAVPHPLGEVTGSRCSWRADFMPPTDEDRHAAAGLAAEDAAVETDPGRLVELARLADAASFRFLRQQPFRGELRSWMRLSPRHPRWSRDGLNADAMAMSRIEAVGAGLVLGPLFGLLDRLHVAEPLLAERSKMASATGLVVFHRPCGEDPFVSGAHFYRLWLRLEQAGFAAAVIAALADDRPSAERLAELVGLPAERRVVSSFRIGRRPTGVVPPRARCDIREVLV